MHINSFETPRAPHQSSGSPLAQDRKLKASDTRLLKHTVCSIYADGWGYIFRKSHYFFCSKKFLRDICLNFVERCTQTHAERTHNTEGEGALRQALIDGGYVETPGVMYSTWVKGETSHIKRNAENVESNQGDSNESTDRDNQQSSSGHGFIRRARQHAEDFINEFREDGVGISPDAHTASLAAVGDFGDSKKYTAFINKWSEGSVYSTVVAREIFPILQKEIDRLLAEGADQNDLLKAIEDHALQQAYYDPADGTTGTIGPTYGTPAFEFHNARGHLHDTGQYWFGQEGTPEGRIYQV